jgi:hypothetical protein
MLKYKEFSLLTSLRKPVSIPPDILKNFEISNLIRLGLIKEEKEFYANPQTLEIPKETRYDWQDNVRVNLDIDVDSSVENILTELGELFISACKEKGMQTN